MISIQKLTKRFKRLQALYEINVDFKNGQVISLIGPNGSGKTTFIKTILGMVKSTTGSVIVNGKKINGDPSYRNEIGYMPQIGRFPDNMKVGQLFTMMKEVRKTESLSIDDDLIHQFNLSLIYEKPFRTLSGGTRQKVSAALAFYFDPAIVILDEPTAGLDPVSSEILKEKIIQSKKKGKLIIITSHILSDLDELTTDVLYLQEGKMLFFKPIQTMRKETGEEKLGKIISSIMKEESSARLWVDKVLAFETPITTD
jgi:Cu-processing system ATP-binding protein